MMSAGLSALTLAALRKAGQEEGNEGDSVISVGLCALTQAALREVGFVTQNLGIKIQVQKHCL